MTENISPETRKKNKNKIRNIYYSNQDQMLGQIPNEYRLNDYNQ